MYQYIPVSLKIYRPLLAILHPQERGGDLGSPIFMELLGLDIKSDTGHQQGVNFKDSHWLLPTVLQASTNPLSVSFKSAFSTSETKLIKTIISV